MQQLKYSITHTELQLWRVVKLVSSVIMLLMLQYLQKLTKQCK